MVTFVGPANPFFATDMVVCGIHDGTRFMRVFLPSCIISFCLHLFTSSSSPSSPYPPLSHNFFTPLSFSSLSVSLSLLLLFLRVSFAGVLNSLCTLSSVFAVT